MTPDVESTLALVLAKDRTAEERIGSLAALSGYLADNEALVALAGAARTEGTASVRAAMFGLVAGADPSQLVELPEVVEVIEAFSALEPEPSVRLAANQCLGGLGPWHPSAWDVLAENLVYDLDASIQAACLNGLAKCTRKAPALVDRLVAYARQAPPALRPLLVEIYEQLGRDGFEAGLTALLDPLEDEALRRQVLSSLGRLPSLTLALTGPLAAYLQVEQVPELRQAALELLCAGAQSDPGVLSAALEAVVAVPEEAGLLRAFCDRLGSVPGAVDQLQGLFGSSGSTRVKHYLLELLAESASIALFTTALGDPSALVRAEAVSLCARRGREQTELVGSALARRIPDEPSPWLRGQMIAALANLGPLSAPLGDFVVGWLPREVAPDGRRALAEVLPQVALTDSNRPECLRAYLDVLRDPMFEPELKQKAAQRLRSFEYRGGPEMAECLAALLESATDAGDLQGLYEQLRSLQVAPDRMLALVHKLFYRFVGSYPQAPLDDWARQLADAASNDDGLRAEIPYLVGLTGATWLLGKAGAADQKSAIAPAILDAIHQGTFNEPERLLADAYEKRSLRKSDAISLFNTLSSYHATYPLVDALLEIFKQTGIADEGLLQRCLNLVTEFPGATVAYRVTEYLKEMGPGVPAWAGRLDEAFSPEGLKRYRVAVSEPDRTYPAAPDWEHYWSGPGERRDWPVAELFLSQAPAEVVAGKLDLPLSADAWPAHRSLHCIVLAHFYAKDRLAPFELAAIGRLARRTMPPSEAGLVHDRALYVYSGKWPEFVRSAGGDPLDPELARMAAEVWVELCQRHHSLGPSTAVRDPAPLPGMDLDHAQATWPLGLAEWDALWLRYAGYLQQPAPGATAGPGAGGSAGQGQAGRPPPFRPLGAQAHQELFEFFFRTPLGHDEAWPARFKTSLQAGQWHPDFSALLSRAPAADQQRVDELLSG
ncbi:MAG: hypothetical protein ABSE77_03300 [Acidimicrobiales bacterium]